MRLPSKRSVWMVWALCLGLAGFATYRALDGDRHPAYAGNLARMVEETSLLPSNHDLPITPLVLLDFTPGRWPESGTMDDMRVMEIERLIDARSVAVRRSGISNLGFNVQLFNEAAGIVGPNALCTVSPPGFDRMLADLDKRMADLLAELGITHPISAMEQLAAQRFPERLDARPREDCGDLLAFMAVGYSMGEFVDVDRRLKLRLGAAARSGSAADWTAVRELDDRMRAVFSVLIDLTHAVATSNDVRAEARQLVDKRLEQADAVWKQESKQRYLLLFIELMAYFWVATSASSWRQSGINSALAERRAKKATDKVVLQSSAQP